MKISLIMASLSVLWLLTLPIFVFVFVILSSFNSQWNIFIKSITKGPRNSNKVAITFDDGPNATITPKVLEILDKQNAKATFFCIGKCAEKHPNIVREIKEAGHEVGNHSYSHSYTIDFKKTIPWIKEIRRTDNILQSQTSKQPIFFRPPYGVTTPHLARALKTTQHKCVGWSVRSFDTVLKTPERILNRITKQIHPGSIILLHDTVATSPSVLEQLLHYLSEKKLQAVTISELLSDATEN